jgi:hypothetical protein
MGTPPFSRSVGVERRRAGTVPAGTGHRDPERVPLARSTETLGCPACPKVLDGHRNDRRVIRRSFLTAELRSAQRRLESRRNSARNNIPTTRPAAPASMVLHVPA